MRRKRNTKRKINPDPKFDNELLAKFINHLMLGGKKSLAEKVIYDALDNVASKEKSADPVTIFNTAVSNVSPLLEVKSRRVGGANYQVPCEVKGNRRTTLAMRWIIQASRTKKGKPMAMKLADELLAASKNEGDAMKKRDHMHRMAEANKAFAHFAW